jgi:hypothetical protein
MMHQRRFDSNVVCDCGDGGEHDDDNNHDKDGSIMASPRQVRSTLQGNNSERRPSNKSNAKSRRKSLSWWVLSVSFVSLTTTVLIIPYAAIHRTGGPFKPIVLEKRRINNVQQQQQQHQQRNITTFVSRKFVPIDKVVFRNYSKENDPTTPTTACAICFFGLPRSFELLVLPSIEENVFKQNDCDVYFHYYHIPEQHNVKTSRSGNSAFIDTSTVSSSLNRAVQHIYNDDNNNKIHLSIVNDTEESFFAARGDQLQRYLTTKGVDGQRLYYPWMAKSFDETSVRNIIKQWHSIARVWKEMERCQHTLRRKYTRVAMLRNDVVYVTPFQIHQISKTQRDNDNKVVTVPNWAKFPINDRMVYGPYDAVKIWATERFDRLETHVLTYEPGYGLHSERFLNHSIFPPIRGLGYDVATNPQICFFRARPDGSVWINDCATRNGAAEGFRDLNAAQAIVEQLVGHPCVRSKFRQRIVQVHCSLMNSTNMTNNIIPIKESKQLLR